MSMAGIVLALSSALLHAVWNYLAKRSRHPQHFITLLQVAAVVMLTPLAVYDAFGVSFQTVNWPAVWWSCVFEAVYILTLAQSYRSGNLSMAYPVSRGILSVALIVLTPFVIAGQDISPLGLAGILIVVIGIYGMFLPAWSWSAFGASLEHFRKPSVLWSVVSGVSIAAYSLAYKIALPTITPVFLLLLTFITMAVSSGVVSVMQGGSDVLKEEWAAHKVSIMVAGLFSFVSFWIFLYAVKLLNLAYLSAIRNSSIVFTVILGAFFLKEKVTLSHWIGTGIIIIGCMLITFA
jgi:drug/metabolite transporter (DMT)-like permease